VRFIPTAGTQIELAHKSRIQVGRTAEVLDDRRRLVRRNDVVLEDATVSRAHAHLEFDSAAGHFRLFDDGSSYGTGVIHDGRLVDVPKAGARGMSLHSGDDIYFGQSRVRFEVIQ
jgi:pSer/pThr/pTyr-binding forkhead associated (FHA) protein